MNNRVDTRSDTIVHRGIYTLELGYWHATCRVCDWTVSDKDRRRAAAQFRQHIRAASEEAARSGDASTSPATSV
jgi:hypothetical protein